MRCLLITLQEDVHVIGLKYIASSITRAGYDTRILILPGYNEQRLIPPVEGFIREYDPDLIGFSLMSTDFHNTAMLTSLIRREFDIPILWGGVHVTLYPEECLRHADYICVGEGEYPIVSLLDHLKSRSSTDVPDIPGIWLLRDGRIYGGERVSPPVKPADLPKQEFMPEYIYCLYRGSIYNLRKTPEVFRRYSLHNGRIYLTVTTRGCPFSCGYCANAYLADTYGGLFRERTVGDCIEELKGVKGYGGIRYIGFEDHCFLLHNREWIERFSEEYRRHIGLPFMLRVDPQTLDRVKLMRLRKAGLIMVTVDIKSCSERVNREFFQRRISHSYLVLSSEILSDSRVAASYEILTGNPLETDEDRIEAINIMSGLKKPFIIHTLPFTFIPGTPLREMAEQAGISGLDRPEHDHYLDRLLLITPYIPRLLIRHLNRPAKDRGIHHALLLNILYILTRVIIKPLFDSFTIARSNHYNPSRTVRAILLRLSTGPAVP
jgi:radical SAM superfamily enzyme YgiQ (UPF0313 family)